MCLEILIFENSPLLIDNGILLVGGVLENDKEKF